MNDLRKETKERINQVLVGVFEMMKEYRELGFEISLDSPTFQAEYAMFIENKHYMPIGDGMLGDSIVAVLKRQKMRGVMEFETVQDLINAYWFEYDEFRKGYGE